MQLTTPLLLHKPCKRFASVARVCQRQLAFLVLLYIAAIANNKCRRYFLFAGYFLFLAYVFSLSIM